jgi:hypothetical protein
MGTESGAGKVQTCWMPMTEKGIFWPSWAGTNKLSVRQELDGHYFGSWEAEGVEIVKVEIHKPKKGKVRK